MKASLIVSIGLRVMAVFWMLQGGASLLYQVSSMAGLSSLPAMSPSFALVFLVPGFYIAIAIVAWVFAGSLARKVVGAADAEVAFPGLGVANFYTTGILILGLYFFLSHIGGALNWLHYLSVTRTVAEVVRSGGISTAADSSTEPNFYNLASELVPCVLGGVLSIFSVRYGEKLARKHRSVLEEMNRPQ